MDLQPSSLLSPLSIFDRLELHDRLPHPCRSRGIPHSVACGEDTRNHEPNILPRGQQAAQIPPQSRDRSRTSPHPSRRKCLCYPTKNHYSVSRGFPFSVTSLIPGCFGPGGPLGCLAYDPVLVVLNYLFWVGLSFAVLTLASWVRTRGAKLHSKEQHPKILIKRE